MYFARSNTVQHFSAIQVNSRHVFSGKIDEIIAAYSQHKVLSTADSNGVVVYTGDECTKTSDASLVNQPGSQAARQPASKQASPGGGGLLRLQS